MAASQIKRAVRRMAMQMVEDIRLEAPLTLVGVNNRGHQLASMLHDALLATGHTRTQLMNLDVHNNRLNGSSSEAILTQSSHIFLVDDVLFSGSTMMQALRFVLDHANPDFLKIAVLVDRGHRNFPIQPDYVGVVSPTKLNEHVIVSFTSDNEPDSVRLEFSHK